MSEQKPYFPELESEIHNRLDALNSQVEELSRKATMGDMNIIASLMNLSKDPKEWIKLAKAIAHVSKILPEIQDLENKKNVIKFAEENPSWIQMAFYGESSLSDEAIAAFVAEGEPK